MSEVICENCGKAIELVNNAGRYWKHSGRDVASAWCDEKATTPGPRAEPPAPAEIAEFQVTKRAAEKKSEGR